MDVPKNYRSVMIFRAIVGFIGVTGMFASVKYMPVSTASCIFFSMPIWATIICYLFLKEKLTKLDLLALIFAFLGVVIINNPWE